MRLSAVFSRTRLAVLVGASTATLSCTPSELSGLNGLFGGPKTEEKKQKTQNDIIFKAPYVKAAVMLTGRVSKPESRVSAMTMRPVRETRSKEDFVCNAVLISEDTVVTSHNGCVSLSQGEVSDLAIVLPSHEFADKDHRISVSSVARPNETSICSNTVAFLKLNKPLPTSAFARGKLAFSPASVASAQLNPKSGSGSNLRLVSLAARHPNPGNSSVAPLGTALLKPFHGFFSSRAGTSASESLGLPVLSALDSATARPSQAAHLVLEPLGHTGRVQIVERREFGSGVYDYQNKLKGVLVKPETRLLRKVFAPLTGCESFWQRRDR